MPKKRRTTTIRRRKARGVALDLEEHTRRQVSAVIIGALGIVLLLSLYGNGGTVGRLVASWMTLLFGMLSFVFPVVLLLISGLLLFSGDKEMGGRRAFGLTLCFIALLGIIQLQASDTQFLEERTNFGGSIGFLIAFPFVAFLSRPVGYTMLVAALLAGLFITFEINIAQLLENIFRPGKVKDVERKPVASTAMSGDPIEEGAQEDEQEEDEEEPDLNIVRPSMEVTAAPAAKPSKPKPNSEMIEMRDTRFEDWKFPDLDLLDSKRSELHIDDEQLKAQAARIKEKLQQFGIDVTMRDAHPGPTVTQFTLEPSEGVKLSKIEALKDDLALALAAQSLRIEAPIPGKSLVGIEMPNEKRSTVYLRELLESQSFRQSESPLTVPLGRGVSGEAIVATIEDMPHLLIAGATGAGKSVCMNVFLISLLYQNAPHELKFILIDPKRVELMPYNGIPHLLTPVITESDKALQALRWALAEMGRRLHKFSEAGVRNLAEYNEKQSDDEKLPRIVIVIDELADLMMRQHRKDTETMVARIAQMARAVGMHLIIATQRPSVDVITGLIKANIPTRIAFRVVSAVDSRTILDGIGAEDLLGRGDMLLSTASTPNPIRIQGIYVSTKESERVINAVKIAGGGALTEEITLGAGSSPENPDGENQNNQMIDLDADDNGGDDLFFDAVRIVQETGKASASLLQRQLKVGYARAARLLDIMEEKGLIGPADGAKARKIMIGQSSDSSIL